MNNFDRENPDYWNIKTRQLNKAIQEGTYQAKPDSFKRWIVGFKFDGTDLHIDKIRLKQGKPYLLVVDHNCFGYFNQGNLLRSMQALVKENLELEGRGLIMGFRPLIHNKSYELVKPLQKNKPYKIYLDHLAVILILAKRLYGFDRISSNLRTGLGDRVAAVRAKHGLNIQAITVKKSMPTLYRYLKHREYDQAFIAKHNASKVSSPYI